MKPCWCKFVLAVLVVVFAWWDVSWARIALTILGLSLAIMSLWGVCCCGNSCKCEEKK